MHARMRPVPRRASAGLRRAACLALAALCLASAPARANVQSELAFHKGVVAYGEQRYDEALTYVEKSNRLQPGSAATLDSLGWIRLKLGQRKQALALLREAWNLEEDPEIAAHFGEALWRDGKRGQGRRVWKRGRELDPDNRALRTAFETFKP